MELTLTDVFGLIDGLSSAGLIFVVVWLFLRAQKEMAKVHQGTVQVQQEMVKQDAETARNVNNVNETILQTNKVIETLEGALTGLMAGITEATAKSEARMDRIAESISSSLGNVATSVSETKEATEAQAIALQGIKQSTDETNKNTSAILDQMQQNTKVTNELTEKIDTLIASKAGDASVLQAIRDDVEKIQKATQETVAVVEKMNQVMVINPPAPIPPNENTEAKPTV